MHASLAGALGPASKLSPHTGNATSALVIAGLSPHTRLEVATATAVVFAGPASVRSA
jgi:hypothetical protein